MALRKHQCCGSDDSEKMRNMIEEISNTFKQSFESFEKKTETKFSDFEKIEQQLEKMAGEVKQVVMATGRNLMRAIKVFEFGGPEVLKLQLDMLLPIPKENQVLIKVHACGINPVDTYIRSGSYKRKPSLPYTPGTDVAGVVQEVGEHVTAFKKGDRVFTLGTISGGYAEYAVASVDTIFPLSDKLDFKQGAAIGIPYFTAYRALFQKGSGKAGETVLVHGASGGVGIAACQMAKAYGLKVWGTAGTEEGMNLVLKNGACKVFNHRKADYFAEIKVI